VGVWGSLLAIAAARSLFALLPGMWIWGLNLYRFLGPIEGWGLGAVGLLCLAWPVAVRGDRLLERAGAALTRRRWRWLAAAAIGALVWLLPDRTWITGDFMLRDAAVESGGLTANFSQSLPLELFLNRFLPALGTSTQTDPNSASRLLGALAAAGLALAGLAITGVWGLEGRARTVATAVILGGGYLTVFTGLGKPAAVLCVFAVVLVAGATRLVRDGRGGLVVGLTLAVALLTHRSALAFVPVWLVAVAASIRRGAWKDSGTRRELLLALLPPIVVMAIVGPWMWRIVATFDLTHHLLPAAQRRNPLAAALAGPHLLDLANLILVYTTAMVPAAFLAIRARESSAFRLELRVLLALALAQLPLLLFVHPIQGVFRDLEVFAPAGVATALLAARLLGAGFQSGRLDRRLALGVVAAALIPALQWLVHFHDTPRGVSRARAFAMEAPTRSSDELAQLWDLLAYRGFRLQQWDVAVEATAQSVRYAPHLRARLMLAIAQSGAGRHAAAESTYLDLASREPDEPLVWVGLLGASLRVQDTTQARRAMERIRSYPRAGREARAIRAHVRHFPFVLPGREELGAAPPATP